MDEELKHHFEDIFQLLDDICDCMGDVNASIRNGTPSNVIPFKIQDIKSHISEASAFLTEKV